MEYKENYQFTKVELKEPIPIKELVEDNLSENEFLNKKIKWKE